MSTPGKLLLFRPRVGGRAQPETAPPHRQLRRVGPRKLAYCQRCESWFDASSFLASLRFEVEHGPHSARDSP